MKYALSIILIVACLWAGFSLREKNIGERAIHADESEQATTAMTLLDTGEYKYNPNGPHGPTLYYWASVTQKAPNDTATIQDFRRSLTPILLILAIALILSGRYVGRPAAWGALAAFAMSAFAQIYSGYFVQEIIFALLVYMLAVSIWQFVCSPNVIVALLTGALLGLTQATKETAIISYFAMFLSLCTCIALEPRLRENAKWMVFSKSTPILALSFFVGASVTFVALYSSFGENWQGVIDAFKSYTHFFEKAESSAHASGFLYYTKLLTLQKCDGTMFGELPLTLLALFGFLSAIFFRKKSAWKCTFVIYVFLNAFFAIAALSYITYKTPWLLLSPIVFLCVSAGFGAFILGVRKNIFFSLIGFAVITSLAWWQYNLSSNTSVRYHSDPRNPFIYSHTVNDFENLTNRIIDASKYSEYKNDIPVAFVMKQSAWPAPFVLRKYQNIGFWNPPSMPQNFDIFDIIVCDYSTEKSVRKNIDTSKYSEEFFGLRKNLILTVFVKKEILDKIISEN